MILMSFWLVMALFLDQLSKKIIVELVSPGETIEVLGNFLMITNVGNTGISFGMFQGYTNILIPLVFVIIIMVFIVSLKFIRESKWLAFAFGSIIGGALGNQIDRLFKGAVVDFIYVNGFAVFNVSDSFVVVGAIILGIHTIFTADKEEKTLRYSKDIKNKLFSIVNKGTFDHFGKDDTIIKEFINWLFNNQKNNIILCKKGAKTLVSSLLGAYAPNDSKPLIVIQDLLGIQSDELDLDSNKHLNHEYEVFYLSSIKNNFKNKLVFENERQFRVNSIYDSTFYENQKKQHKKPLLQLIIADINQTKKEAEGRHTMINNDFILEIMTEEIPPTEIAGIKEQFEKGFSDFLQNLRIKHDQLVFFYAARRFGIYVNNLHLKQEDLEEIKRGPAKKIAFDQEGKPTKALVGFLKGNKANEDDLVFKEENSNIYCYIKRTLKGGVTREVLERNLSKFLENLNFKKPMRWAEGKYKFVRPVHNILAILSMELIQFSFLGIHSSKQTYGHRFKESMIEIESADVYFKRLKENNVYADPLERKEKIIKEIKEVEMKEQVKIPADEELIEEVTAITEFPNAVFGEYDVKFLSLPKEVLITALKHHQRTFPVLRNNQIIPHFLSFQDNEAHSEENVKAGYKKVIEARLEDALFYYREDLKKSFENRTDELKEIGFQNKLGTLFEKVQRNKELSSKICSILMIDSEYREYAKKATLLMKNDLTTHMVYEFPELQGVIGRIYAKKTGEPYEVYQAIEEQYSENVPETVSGCITTLSDNLDTIAGNLLINNIPSGSKDPFALRRALTKCLYIIIRREWDLDLVELFSYSLNLYNFDFDEEKKESLMQIFKELLKNRIEYYLQEKGIHYDMINATIHLADSPLRCILSADALMKLRIDGDFTDLTRIFERIHNISKKHTSHHYDSRLFEHQEEIQLEEKFNDIRDEVSKSLERFDYNSALHKIKELRFFVDNYFDNVFVMAEREDLKLTRLGFLKTLDDFLLKMGDFSEIVQNKENGYE